MKILLFAVKIMASEATDPDVDSQALPADLSGLMEGVGLFVPFDILDKANKPTEKVALHRFLARSKPTY